MAPQLVLHNGKITTLSPGKPDASAVAITDGMVSAIGSADDVLALAGAQTEKIDLNHRRVIPGLNDSHLHVIRAGLFYNLELRWDGVASVSQALQQLKQQADNTPPPQWVRVIGGWNEFQFVEGRMPTLDEINKAAPNTPVFLLHLYDSALLNGAALRVLGFNRDTPNPPGGLIARDSKGNPTGLLIAEPSALILSSSTRDPTSEDRRPYLNSAPAFANNRCTFFSSIAVSSRPGRKRLLRDLHDGSNSRACPHPPHFNTIVRIKLQQ